MPGPAKGYVSVSDPRRKRWEQLQGTSAGGTTTGYIPSAVPGAPLVPVGSSGSSAAYVPPPPSKVEMLKAYRLGRSDEQKEAKRQESNLPGKGARSLAASLANADNFDMSPANMKSLAANAGRERREDRRSEARDRRQDHRDEVAGNQLSRKLRKLGITPDNPLDVNVGRELGQLDRGMKQSGAVAPTLQKTQKKKTNSEINQIARPVITAELDAQPAPSSRKTEAEERNIKFLEKLRDSPKQQGNRDLMVATMSRDDWKESQAITSGIQNPWDGTNDKTPTKQQRQIVRRLAKQDGAQPLLPTSAQEKFDADNYVEEAVGLGFSPVDVALLVGGVGLATKALKGGKAALEAGAAAAKAAKLADEGTSAARAITAAKAAGRTTKTGKGLKKYRTWSEGTVRKNGKVTRRKAFRGGRRTGYLGASGAFIGAGNAPEAIEGVVTADKTESVAATARSLVSMFVAPVTIATAGAVTARRLAGQALTGEGNTERSLAPSYELGKALVDETKHMFGTYWGGSADEIRKMTENDYGYIGPLNATVMAAAGLKGAGVPAFNATLGKIPTARGADDSFKDGPNLSEAFAARGTKVAATVFESRASGEAEVKIKHATQRIEKARSTLNRATYNKYMKGLKQWNKERLDLPDGADHYNVDIVSVVLYGMAKGFDDGAVTNERIDKLVNSSIERGSMEMSILEAARHVPAEAWDASTDIGKQVRRIQLGYAKDIHPYLIKGRMGKEMNALKMETFNTIEQVTGGQQRAPKHPSVEAANKYDRMVGDNRDDLREHDTRTRDKVDGQGRAATAALRKHKRESTSAERIAKMEQSLARAEKAVSEGAKPAVARAADLRKRLNEARLDHDDWMAKSDAERASARTDAERGVTEARAARAKFGRDWKALAKERDRLSGALTKKEKEALKVTVERQAERIENPEAHIKDVTAENASLAKVLPEDSRELALHTKMMEDMEDHIADKDKGADGPESASVLEEKKLKRNLADLDDASAKVGARRDKYKTGSKLWKAAQEELGELDAERARNELQLKVLDRKRVTDIRTDLMVEGLKGAKANKVEAVRKALEDEAQVEFNRLLDERMEQNNLVLSFFAPWNDTPDNLPEFVHATTGSQGLRNPEIHRREHSTNAKTGHIDRRWEPILKAVIDKTQSEKNRSIAGYVERNAMYSRIHPDTGQQQLYWTMAEIKSLPQKTQAMLRRRYNRMDEQVFRDPGNGHFEDAFDPETGSANLTLETAMAGKMMNPGERFALVDRGTAKRLVDQQGELNEMMKFFERTGRWSSKIVLGLSPGWALTQPVAEALTLLLSHPNPAAWINAYKVRSAIIKGDPEAAGYMRLHAGTVLGTNVLTTDRARNWDTAGRAIRHQKHSPEGQILKSVASIEVLGDIDRWKGAAIRELGAIMEIDHNLKKSVRAAKATLGTMDAVERIADKLDSLGSWSEIYRYLYSKQGLRDSAVMTREIRNALEAGDLLIKKVDRQQGNWTAVAPGLESAVSSLVFFYPFVRFSLKWAFQTYPADHPVRYALLSTLGAFNGNMVADIMQGEPSYFTDQIAVPVYDEEGKVVSLFNVARFAGTGNSVMDLAGGVDDPLDLLQPLMPLVNIGVSALATKDGFGSDLTNAEGGTPTLGDRAKSIGSDLGNLAYPYRELKRQGLFGDPRGPMVGDNPDETEALIGRMFGPVGQGIQALLLGDNVGVPTEVVRSKALTNKLFEQYIQAGLDSDLSSTGPAKKAKGVEEKRRKALFADDKDEGAVWKPRLKHALELHGEFSSAYSKVLTGYVREQVKFNEWRRTDPGYQQWKIEQAARDLASLTRDTTAYALWRQAKLAGAPVPTLEAGALERGTELWRSRSDHQIDQPDKVYNYVTGNMVFENSVRDIGEPFHKDWHRRTVPFGGRAWGQLGHVDNLGWEVKDAEGNYKIRKPGDPASPLIEGWDELGYMPGQVQVPFGGRAWGQLGHVDNLGWDELGYMPGQVQVQTRNGPARGQFAGLDTDAVPGLNVPRKQKVVLARKIVKAKRAYKMSGGNGAPTKVPAKYKTSISKWGNWLEKQPGMKSPDDSMVDGLIPKSMSGAEYLSKLIQHESDWNHDAYNDRASATGMAQFIPTTRQSMIDNHGVDPWASGQKAIQGAALLLSAGGLEGYNPGYPTSGDNQGTPGTWSGYLNEDVGKPTQGGGKKQQAALKQEWMRLVARGKAMGVYEVPEKGKNLAPVTFEDLTGRGTLNQVEKPVTMLAKHLARVIGEEENFPITSGVRPESAGSLHQAGHALDIEAYSLNNAAGTAATQARGDKIAYNAVLAMGGKAAADKYRDAGFNAWWGPNGEEVIWGYNDASTGGDHTHHVHIGIPEGAPMPMNLKVKPMSPMQQVKSAMAAKAAANNTPTGGTTGGGTSGGGTSGGGGTAGGGATGGGAPGQGWANLQAFRLGSDPNQQVPMWGGGSSPSDGKSELPMLAESIVGALGGGTPARREEVTTSGSAGTMGLPAMPSITQRKKKIR